MGGFKRAYLWGVEMKLKLKTHDDFKGGLGCDYPLIFESPGAYVTGDMIMIPGEDLIAAGWNFERTSKDGYYSFYLNRQCEVL